MTCDQTQESGSTQTSRQEFSSPAELAPPGAGRPRLPQVGSRQSCVPPRSMGWKGGSFPTWRGGRHARFQPNRVVLTLTGPLRAPARLTALAGTASAERVESPQGTAAIGPFAAGSVRQVVLAVRLHQGKYARIDR